MYTKEDFNKARQEIKGKVTIPILWEQIYGSFPKRWNDCRCPWREDQHPSFWVSPDGQRWQDRASGETGDIFDFYMRAAGCDARQALLDLLGIAGNQPGPVPIAASSLPGSSELKRKFHPPLRVPSSAELSTISALRSISVEALRIAVTRGFLWMAQIKAVPAFVLTDQSRKCYLARKLDGARWEDGAKAVFLPGSQAKWPIGSREAQNFPAVALAEGGPDFMAAFGHVWASGVENKIAPVCMSSSGGSIPPDALSSLTGKRVRIFAHADEAGANAYGRWQPQLTGIAGKIDGFDFTGLVQTDGQPVTDLNDLLRIDYDCWEANRSMIDGIMSF